MQTWKETSTVVERTAELSAEGRRCALATVTAINGSAYRRPGARMLIDDAGGSIGGVSGGCLEADVREVALECLADGEARLRHYDTGEDEDVVWGLGLGCDGAVDVLVRPLPDPDPVLERVRALLRGDDRFVLATVLADGPVGATILIEPGEVSVGSTGDADLDAAVLESARKRLEAGGTATERVAGVPVFLDALDPPPRLLLFGAGDDAIPLAALAAKTGFRVTVVDHRPAFTAPDRFPDAAIDVRRPEEGLDGLPVGPDAWAVVATHAIRRDETWVARLLETDVAYVGILGPRDRREEILEALGRDDPGRVYGPVGIDVGADGPAQIAVSVVAELLAVRAGRTPRHLRERERSIHDETSGAPRPAEAVDVR